MNFPLQKLESNVPETALVKGELAFEGGRIDRLFEIDRHLWVATVEEGAEVYEVEIRLSPSRVKAATCECAAFQTEGICEHIVAVLLLLRKEQQQKKEKNRQKKKTRKRQRKLTTGLVLDHVEHDELVAFVRQYARANRNFAIALKARFAASIDGMDDKSKYLQLLETTISAARKANRKISIRGIQKIRKVLDELFGQIEDKLARKHFPEALGMAQSIIEKITPILNKAERSTEEMEEVISQAFSSISQMLNQPPPPLLKDRIWEYSREESQKFIYRSRGTDRQFIQLMIQLAEGPERVRQLSELLDEMVEKYRQENRNTAPLLLDKLQLLEKADQTDAVARLIRENLSEPTLLRYVLRQAQSKDQWSRTKMLARYGLEQDPDPSIRIELEEILLDVAVKEKDRKEIARFAEKRLLESLRLPYYQQLKEHYPGQWATKADQLITRLQALPYSIRQRDLIAAVYAMEGRQKALLDFLRSTRSVDLLIAYDRVLLDDFRKEILQIYRETLTQYLQNHLGRKPSVKIRQIMTHLLEAGAGELARELASEFREKYPERHSLLEELELF